MSELTPEQMLERVNALNEIERQLRELDAEDERERQEDTNARKLDIQRQQRDAQDLEEELEMRLPVSTHDAYTTSWTRNRLGIPKIHVNDALCVGAPGSITDIPARKTLVMSAGHGDRQMLRPADKHGNPRDKGYYCALDRQQQGCNSCPGHRSRSKRISSIASGDMVRINHPKRGVLRDYAILDKKRGRVAITMNGKPVSVMSKDAMLLARNHGYRLSTTTNE